MLVRWRSLVDSNVCPVDSNACLSVCLSVCLSRRYSWLFLSCLFFFPSPLPLLDQSIYLSILLLLYVAWDDAVASLIPSPPFTLTIDAIKSAISGSSSSSSRRERRTDGAMVIVSRAKADDDYDDDYDDDDDDDDYDDDDDDDSDAHDLERQIETSLPLATKMIGERREQRHGAA